MLHCGIRASALLDLWDWSITSISLSDWWQNSPLRWRHNDHAGVSNHQPPGCLLNRLFRRKSKKTSKLRVTGLCAGNSPGTGEFSAQMASYAENVSIWWRHHASMKARFGPCEHYIITPSTHKDVFLPRSYYYPTLLHRREFSSKYPNQMSHKIVHL